MQNEDRTPYTSGIAGEFYQNHEKEKKEMSRRAKVIGLQLLVLLLLIVVALLLVAGLAVGGLVIYPQLQEKRV